MQNTFRKLTALALCLALSFSLLPFSVRAGDDPTPENEVETPEADADSDGSVKSTVASGTCGAKLTWTLDSSGNLTIKGTGAMYDYSDSPSPPWDSYSAKIKRVDIMSDVSSIGSYAFLGCNALTEVTISTGLTSIGTGAFSGCSALTEFSIPMDVSVIEEYTFSGCSSLSKVWIPAQVTSIGNNAFSGCSSLATVTLPTELTTLGSAFTDCSALKSVTIPEKVTSIAALTFSGCTSLTRITVMSGNSAYCSKNGVLFNKNATELVRYPIGKTDTSYSIPSGVKTVGRFAFLECVNLKSLEIPSSVTEMSMYSCYGCTALKSLVIHSGPTNIRISAFNECSSLKRITIFGDCPTIGSSFKGVTADVHYLAGNSTFAEDKMIDYGGSLTWIGDKLLFTDVTDPEEYFLEPVYWAVNKGVTTGTKPTTFEPYKTCTRGQIITFIWRVMGSPEPESYKNPFKDVKSTDYFYKPVLWSYYRGINYGKTPTTFCPYMSCTREQAMTFLWRAQGKPKATVGTRFIDVNSGTYYAEAVYWALGKGITTGQTETTFGVGRPCTRGQIITFLYRYAKLTGRL